MQIFVPVLLLAIAAVSYGRVVEPVTAPEEDGVDSYHGMDVVGVALENINKWPLRRGRFYTAEDGDGDDAEDFSPKDLREMDAVLEKLAVALEEGKTLDAALDGDEASEYGIGKWAKRIRGWAKQIPPVVVG
uniref:Putative secreted protein n=1 Tax=Ixodes ricinus TaxID=34613 RepID=V5HPU4_IXORI